MTSSRFLRISIAFLLATPLFAAAQGTITGTVLNKTTNKPSVGDEITLIRLAQGMQESTKATSDAKGNFTLQVPDAGMHLVRVTHDKTPYFRPAPPGTESIEVEVYNSAAKVEGVTLEADVMRIQTDASGKRLQIVEHFFLKNDSTPPKTQFSDRPFDFWLPTDATISGSAALWKEGGMPVQSSPMPLTEKGHYSFIFPIRPGETQFQITYEVPYDGGKATLTPKLTMKTGTIALMMPKSLKFEPSSGAPYNLVEELGAQTYVARNVTQETPTSFTVSGAGQLPRDTGAGQDGQAGQAAAGDQSADGSTAGPNNRPGGGLGVPIDTPDPLSKYKWWIISGLALLLAAAAGFLLTGKPATPTAKEENPLKPSGKSSEPALLQTLKEELFQLESDRATGKISEEEYTEQKTALEMVLKRALKRR